VAIGDIGTARPPRDKHDRLALELNRKSERDEANRRKQLIAAMACHMSSSLLALAGSSCPYRGQPVVSGRRIIERRRKRVAG
jgi:hypothetical protein